MNQNEELETGMVQVSNGNGLPPSWVHISDLLPNTEPVNIKELDVYRLNLKPGETLFVKVKSDNLSNESLERFGNTLRFMLPNNQVIVMGIGESEEIDLTILSQSVNVTEELKEGENS